MKRLAPAIAASFAAVALLSSSPRAQAQDAEKTEKAKPVEPDLTAPVELHYPPPSVRFKVLATGVFVTGAAWGGAFAASRIWPENPCIITVAGAVYPTTMTPCTSGPAGSHYLSIPIAGPWLALGKIAYCAPDEYNCTAALTGFRGVAYVVDGVVQVAGLGLILEALIMKTESAADPGKKASAFTMHAGSVELMPIPIATQRMTGLGLTGSF
jgi:hypothetical protein